MSRPVYAMAYSVMQLCIVLDQTGDYVIRRILAIGHIVCCNSPKIRGSLGQLTAHDVQTALQTRPFIRTGALNTRKRL